MLHLLYTNSYLITVFLHFQIIFQWKNLPPFLFLGTVFYNFYHIRNYEIIHQWTTITVVSILTIFKDRKIRNTLKFSAMTATSAVFFPDDSSMISGTND